MDLSNGELSRAMKNRGIEIVVPELSQDNVLSLFKKFNLSSIESKRFFSDDMEDFGRKLFVNFACLALKTQFGQCKIETFDNSSTVFQLPFFISGFICESKKFEISRDSSILRNVSDSIHKRFFLEQRIF